MDASQVLQYGDSAGAALNGIDMSGANAARAKMQSDVNAEQKEISPLIAKQQEIVNTPHPRQPNLEKQTPAPKAEDFNQGSQEWIGALAALSALVGARGRARGTGALKAYAAGMKGIKEGNQQAFENSLKTWEADSKAILENNQTELDEVAALREDRKLSQEEITTGIKLIGAKYQDPLFMDSKDFDQQMKLVDLRQAQAFKYQEQHDKQLEKAEQIKEQLLTPEEINYYAGLKNTGDKASIAAATRGPAGMMNYNAITKRAAELNLKNGVTPEQQAGIDAGYVGQVSGQRSLGIQEAKLKLSSNLLDQSLPSMMEAAKKVGLSDSTDFNSLYNTAKSHMSNEDFSNFRTQMRAVASDYAQFIGRGSGTVHSDEEALRVLNENMGEGGLRGFVNGIQAERSNVQKAMDVTNGKSAVSTSSSETGKDFSHLWSGGD